MSEKTAHCLGLVASVLLTLCTSASYVDGFIAVPGGSGCTDGQVAKLDNADPCSRQYLRCESSVWHPSMCVVGILNNSTGECVPKTRECPDPGITVRSFTSRFRRQANYIDNCLRSYWCPSDITSIFIYPDWANTNCDSYIVCSSATLILSSCLRDGYSYYNPSRLSCEELASPTNICVNRRNTTFLSQTF